MSDTNLLQVLKEDIIALLVAGEYEGAHEQLISTAKWFAVCGAGKLHFMEFRQDCVDEAQALLDEKNEIYINIQQQLIKEEFFHDKKTINNIHTGRKSKV